MPGWKPKNLAEWKRQRSKSVKTRKQNSQKRGCYMVELLRSVDLKTPPPGLMIHVLNLKRLTQKDRNFEPNLGYCILKTISWGWGDGSVWSGSWEDPSTDIEAGHSRVPLIPVLQGRKSDPAHLLATPPSQSVSSRVSGKPCLKTNVESNREKHLMSIFDIHMHVHRCV